MDRLYRKILLSLPLLLAFAVTASAARHQFSVDAILRFCQGILGHLWAYVLPAFAVLALFRAVFMFWLSRKKIASLSLVEAEEYPFLPELSAGSNTRLRIYRSSASGAFTAGFFRPCVYISTSLLEGLDRDELAAVIGHEARHAEKKDPLWSFVAVLVRDALAAFPIVHWLYQQHRIETELDCDRYAANNAGGPLVVADAIIKVHRASGAVFARNFAAVPGLADSSVEKRVKSLLGVEQAAPRQWLLPSFLTGISLVVLAFLIGIGEAESVARLCALA